MAKYDIAYHCVEDGVTQKLQSLIVQRTTFLVALFDALMHQRLLIKLDVSGIEA
jgi:hypothetical protein